METFAVMAEFEVRVAVLFAQEDLGGLDALAQNGIFCQRAAESPHFGACNFPHLAGVAISRLLDQRLRFSAVDHGVWSGWPWSMVGPEHWSGCAREQGRRADGGDSLSLRSG